MARAKGLLLKMELYNFNDKDIITSKKLAQKTLNTC